MTLFQHACRIAAIATAGIPTSCIDGREEVWIDAGGSGRAEISYSLPAAAAAVHGGEAGVREMIHRFLDSSPEITTSSCDVVTTDNRIHVRVKASFDSALDLKNVAGGQSIDKLPSAAAHLAGVVKAGISGRTLDFSRTITAAKALPGSAFIPDSQFEGRRLVYIMHLPAAAADSNATRVEDSGRTLVWDVPVIQALKAPVVTRFRMEIPVPWKLVTAVALPLSLGLGLVFIRLKRPKPVAEAAA